LGIVKLKLFPRALGWIFTSSLATHPEFRPADAGPNGSSPPLSRLKSGAQDVRNHASTLLLKGLLGTSSAAFGPVRIDFDPGQRSFFAAGIRVKDEREALSRDRGA
jgi:hypothetical protein